MNVITTQKSDEFAQLYSYLKEDSDKDFPLSTNAILVMERSSKSLNNQNQHFLTLLSRVLDSDWSVAAFDSQVCSLVLLVVHDDGVYRLGD